MGPGTRRGEGCVAGVAWLVAKCWTMDVGSSPTW